MITVGAEVLVARNLNVYYHVYEDNLSGLKMRVANRQLARRKRAIHAVRGVDLVLREGESLGLIGANGSGKSTLLSALCGLIPPESGDIRVRSRPTLLGVNAALRPHLSGRMNIMIGGLALGMRRSELEARMDELIEFSGLDDFIDLPMRTYSSGMRARLAFTVGTAIDPDILMIDEALAVGDQEFRVRSEARISELREHAGAVVLVSHNLSEIERSCNRAVWLEAGSIRAEGDVDAVIEKYQSHVASSAPS